MTISPVAALSVGRFVVATVSLLLAGCKGPGAAGGCPVVGDCGGDPVGVWQVDPASICNFPVIARPAQNYATPPYFEPETGATPPAVTSGSWCWDLTFTKDQDGTVTVATPSLTIILLVLVLIMDTPSPALRWRSSLRGARCRPRTKAVGLLLCCANVN